MEYYKAGESLVVRLDKGEEVLEQLEELCRRENILLGSISGIGAADYVKVGLFDPAQKRYTAREFSGPMEITSLIGNISTMDGRTYLHCHINVCDEELAVRGGHLNACRISATSELIVTRLPGQVDRRFSEEIGLNLYKF